MTEHPSTREPDSSNNEPATNGPSTNGPSTNEPSNNEPSNNGTSTSGPTGSRPTGLRNPKAAVRGVGAGALAAQGVVLLLAIQPIRVLGGHLTGLAIAVIVVLAVTCFGLAGLLRRSWAWHGGSVVQVVLLLSGFVFHPSLAVLGVLFGLLWTYVLHVRRNVLR
jgi:hypothetical protein